MAGSVTIANGRVEDTVNGLRITELGGSVSFREQSLQVGPLRGRIGGGEITLAGRVGVLEPGMPVDLRMTTRGGRVVDSPFATVAADADIMVRGRAAEEINVTGPITVHRAEFRIAESLPPSLPTIAVREVGGTAQQRAENASVARVERGAEVARAAAARPQALRPQPLRPSPARPPGARNPRAAPAAAGAPEPSAAPPPGGAPRITIDIPIAMPSAVFVRGRGLQAEVGGNLRLRGSGAAAAIEGALDLRRGTFEVAGQRLNFSRGTLSFDPGVGIDPTLDMDASTSAGGVTANIHIGGRASGPTLALSSDPPLPQDEILAHMLFGSATSSLTPTQILRVASAVAELSGAGGGSDVTDRVRRGLGLDVLSVTDVSGSGVGGEAGRYVREGVYVGVRSGRNPGSTDPTQTQTMGVVQIEVLPHLKVEAGAGTTGRIGITYERDY
jgi:translocation and assembly module TamB